MLHLFMTLLQWFPPSLASPEVSTVLAIESDRSYSTGHPLEPFSCISCFFAVLVAIDSVIMKIDGWCTVLKPRLSVGGSAEDSVRMPMASAGRALGTNWHEGLPNGVSPSRILAFPIPFPTSKLRGTTSLLASPPLLSSLSLP